MKQRRTRGERRPKKAHLVIITIRATASTLDTSTTSWLAFVAFHVTSPACRTSSFTAEAFWSRLSRSATWRRRPRIYSGVGHYCLPCKLSFHGTPLAPDLNLITFGDISLTDRQKGGAQNKAYSVTKWSTKVYLTKRRQRSFVYFPRYRSRVARFWCNSLHPHQLDLASEGWLSW